MTPAPHPPSGNPAILPAAQLTERFPRHADAMACAVVRTDRPLNELRTLPLLSCKTAWTVLTGARSAQPVDWVALNSV